MARIFLSYRREDAAGTTGRLADTLSQRFGIEAIFRDVQTIQAGQPFEQAILDAVRAATAVLVVIGPRWGNARNPDGTRRIDDPQDFVRREVEAALEAQTTIVPVLVEGAKMVSVGELPDSMKPLALRQAFELSDAHWRDDCARLVGQLRDTIGIELIEGIEAVPLRTKGAVIVEAIATYLPDLLTLLAHPSRSLVIRSDGRQMGLMRAFVFLLLSLLVASLLLWGGVSGMTQQSLLSFVLNGLMLGSVAALGMSLLLYAAWRLAGAPPGYARIGIVSLYQIAIVVLGLFSGVTVLLVALVWHDTGLPERIRAITTATGAGPGIISASAAALEKSLASREGTAGTLVMLVIHVFIVAWFVTSWGAYRSAVGLPRWRAVVAFILFCLLGWLPVVGTAWVARFLSG